MRIRVRDYNCKISSVISRVMTPNYYRNTTARTLQYRIKLYAMYMAYINYNPHSIRFVVQHYIHSNTRQHQ